MSQQDVGGESEHALLVALQPGYETAGAGAPTQQPAALRPVLVTVALFVTGSLFVCYRAQR